MRRSSRYSTLMATLLIALLATACSDDNPVDDDHDDEHAEPVGLTVSSSGLQLVRYEEGVVTGRIEVGTLKETPLLSVRFLDEDDDLFTPHEVDGFSLGLEIADAEIAETEQHDEDGAWAFHLVGLATGTTTLVVKILHEGHADFVSQPIELHVTIDGPGEALGEHEDG